MVKLNKHKSKLAFIYFMILVLLLFAGCSSTSTITVTEIDTIAVHDTVHLTDIDSIWYGGIYSGTDSIGSIAVIPKSKVATVDIKWLKPDTVLVHIQDTKYLIISQTLEKVLSAMFVIMPFWQKLIVIIMLIAGLVVVYKLWKTK
jgi:hypothetical protein